MLQPELKTLDRSQMSTFHAAWRLEGRAIREGYREALRAERYGATL